ncbi:MAG TPA: hypothetical protein VIS53_03640 [Candidatus Udaeobacter sp.]
MLKLVQPLADASTETFQRLIEMNEFVAFCIINSRQLITRAVPRQAAGEIRQAPCADQPPSAAQFRQKRSADQRDRTDTNPE